MSNHLELNHQTPLCQGCSCSEQDPNSPVKHCATLFFNRLVTAIWLYDVEKYRIVWANPSALRLWEADSLDELTARDYRCVSSLALQQALKDYQQLLKSGKPITRMWRYFPKGEVKEVYSQLSGFKLDDGRLAMLVEALPTELIDSNIDTSSVITISTYHMDGKFISGNPPFTEAQSSNFSHLRSLFYKAEDYQHIRELLDKTGKFEGDVQLITDKKVQWHRLIISTNQDHGLESRLLVQQFNINEMKLKEIELKTESITDPLTGLLNRRGLKDIFASKNSFFIFYIDLDGFKLINDSLGHGFGDKILQIIGKRLSEHIFDKGYACRFGGDEFIWLIEDENLEGSVQEAAAQLLQLISRPFMDEIDSTVSISASVGVAHFPTDGENFNDISMKADSAMYLAKEQGKHRWIRYSPGMENKLQRKSLVSQALFEALENIEFQLYYQPIFNMKTKRICAFEALLRWDSQKLGRVSTEECLQVAEENGFITSIETWVITTAIKDLIPLRKLVDDQVCMAVNISGLYFSNPLCIKHVKKQLECNQLKHTDVHLEITEGTLLSDLNLEDSGVKRTHEAGIAMSIDDFGTGYSSLAYLHQIPASLVKIDRSFTQRVEESSTIISSIQHLITSLKLESIVEGVETLNQSKILADLGLFLQQGYGLGMPQPLSFYENSDNVKNLAGLQ